MESPSSSASSLSSSTGGSEPLPSAPDPAPFGNTQDSEGPGGAPAEPNLENITSPESGPTISELGDSEITHFKRIIGIEPVDQSGKTRLLLADDQSIEVGQDFILQHTPERGGYVVFFDDERTSYYPGGKFESGHDLLPLPEHGELAPATPHPEEPPAYSHLELRAMIMEEIKRLNGLLNKSGAITIEDVADTVFKRIVAYFL